MKNILITGSIFVALVCATAWAAYSIGHKRGYDLGWTLGQRGTFVGTFDGLQKIRAGDVDAGTRRIEDSYFLAAGFVYSGRPGTEFIAKTFFNNFRHYRQTYRTNSADWSIMEQCLERQLANWK